MRLIAAIVIASLLSPGVALAQGGAPATTASRVKAPGEGSADIWRDFSSKVDIGSELKVRLADGTSFNATLIRVDEAGLQLQPRTRVTVPVQLVAYDAIASLAPAKRSGIGTGKAIAIGVGTGVAAFWGMLAIIFAVWAD